MASTFGAAGPAAAASRVRFSIEPKPYSEALIDLALQADVSLLGASACTVSASPGLRGSFTLEEALARLLADAPCTWRLLAARTVEIRPQAAAPEKPDTPPPPTSVAEVLVTATRRVQSADRLAVAVSVISGDQLQASRASDPGDTAGQIAGVLTTNLGPGRDKILLRGLSDGAFTGRARSTVGTYLDDTPLNYNAPDPDLRLADIERVEVVRGPQGALYGGGSLSGLYRIVTRKPDLQSPSASLRAMAASTVGGGPSRSIDGHVNLPVIADQVGVRLAAYHEIEGGYLDDTNLKRNNVDRTQRDGARLSLSIQPGDTWTLIVMGAIQHLKSDDTHYTGPDADRRRASVVAEPHNNDISLVTATVRGSWGWGELVSSTGYVRHAYTSIYDATPVKEIYVSGTDIAIYDERTHTRMLVQDLVLTSRGAEQFSWLAGLHGSVTTEGSPSALRARPRTGDLITVYQDVRRDRITELSAYGEASYEILDGWTVGLGGRVFRSESHTRSQVSSLRFAARSLDRSASFTGVSPKLSLQGELGSDDLIYAVVSGGYRAGGVNSGGALPLPASRETFAADRLINYELGAKFRILDRRLTLRSALFYDLWTNIQTDQFRPSGLPYVANVGDARIGGLEGELAFVTDVGLSIQANGLISRTKITRANPDFSSSLTSGLPGAPDLSGGMMAIYERQLAGDLALRLTGETNYVGRSQVGFDPKLSPQMGGYWRTRFSAGLSGRGWAAQLFVTNPSNALDDTFAYGNPFSFGQVRQVTPQRPRTIGLELSATL